MPKLYVEAPAGQDIKQHRTELVLWTGLPCEIELLLFAAVASFSVVTSGSQEAYIRYQVSPETHMALR